MLIFRILIIVLVVEHLKIKQYRNLEIGHIKSSKNIHVPSVLPRYITLILSNILTNSIIKNQNLF